MVIIGRLILWHIAGIFLRIMFILFFRTRVFGAHNVPRTGGLLIASNHQSFLDPPLIACCLERMNCFMARKSLFRNPIFGRMISALNAIPLARGRPDKAAIRRSVDRLATGWCLVVFPEGTRTRDGEIARLHAGALTIAHRGNVPIVPTVIDGAYEAWPRHGGIRRSRIAVWFGPIVSVEAQRSMSRQELVDLLRAEMLRGQAFLKAKQVRYGGKTTPCRQAPA